MSSTQHQLIEQCATRLRGIVEALDNIHDTSPHRWSTDLDDVHSSAESLLALIKDQAPARSEASFEEWLANELEGEDGQPVPAAVCDIALARRAFNHWPKLEQPAKVGGVRFSAGVSSRLVVEAAQRLYEFESTPEQEAERIERLQAFREQLDPLNLAPHAKAFNEAPAEALKSEQAEAELEKQEPVGEVRESGGTLTAVIVRHSYATKLPVGTKLYAAPVALAQHSVPDGFREKFKQCMELAFAEIAYYVSPEKARDPNSRARKASALATELLDMLAGAPGTEVPQAWLDVQAERRRQVTAEGWTPEHDDAHSHGQMARAAACYALAGSSAPNDGTAALLVSLAWPWDEQWWKPTTTRRDLVKACALGLAEIERLDRAGISQNPQPGATTASS
ncbi:Uncharacterised protein [Pseudomonas aeruginosa]|uniref:hypothetical protein n=1 Tax=Pseudomonas aeruginosa TaxID=287 RepID=UPI0009A7696B|nr:hypothetical protein [Pseudomonas aeruginosa]SQC96553.1 Uncharacterised protein [Pseudomonas aeruginosa]